MKKMLSINNLTKSFNGIELLKNISLDIFSGELIHIRGGNGSGKSTLFKLICDIIEVDDGNITKEDDVSMGALIENPNFFEGENIKVNLKFLAEINHNYDEKKIVALARGFNLDYKNKLKMKKYSVGMRQKVGIIQAVMENQNLIFLDEPSRGLDKESIDYFCNLVIELTEQNKTVVIASHDDLSELCFSKRYLLEKGELKLES